MLEHLQELLSTLLQIMNNISVAILLSTYNGAKYIKYQIESILNQDYKSWDLYIRDDGSTDNTIQIIKRYEKCHKNIHLVKDSNPHRGVRDSFLYLLSIINSEYYMFCDQDDVWLPSKISRCIEEMSKKIKSPSKPILICCDLEVVDCNLNQIYPSLWRKYNIIKLVQRANKSLIIAPLFQGCTMFFNKSARDTALNIIPHDSVIHDNHLTMSVVSAGGEIIPIFMPLIKYRQHSANVEGALIGSHIKVTKLLRLKEVIHRSVSLYKISNYYFHTTIFEYLRNKILYLIHN